MIEVLTTDEFDSWIAGLKDTVGRANIVVRIRRLGLGNAGDSKPIGSGISEMRIHVGPGYRLYYKKTGTRIILLLCGGDKASQIKDIKRAKQLAEDV